MDGNSSIPNHASSSARRWFWITVIVGAVIPATGLLGQILAYWLRFGFGAWRPFPTVLVAVLLWEILSLWPFLILARGARSRVLACYKTPAAIQELMQTKMVLRGAITGLAIPYAAFWLFVASVPFFGQVSEEFDWAGLGQAMSVILIFLLPIVGLITCFVGALFGLAISKILTMRPTEP